MRGLGSSAGGHHPTRDILHPLVGLCWLSRLVRHRAEGVAEALGDGVRDALLVLLMDLGTLFHKEDAGSRFLYRRS